jgi:hypothetical protein
MMPPPAINGRLLILMQNSNAFKTVRDLFTVQGAEAKRSGAALSGKRHSNVKKGLQRQGTNVWNQYWQYHYLLRTFEGIKALSLFYPYRTVYIWSGTAS